MAVKWLKISREQVTRDKERGPVSATEQDESTDQMVKSEKDECMLFRHEPSLISALLCSIVIRVVKNSPFLRLEGMDRVQRERVDFQQCRPKS